MAPEARSVAIPNQVILSYGEQGDATGIPVVLMHGLADSWHSFDLVAPHLPASIHAFALSQRGHGDSSRPAEGYRSQHFAGDLAAFMDVVDVEAAVIVAHSAAGFTAQRFALDHPDRTLGLVFISSPFSMYHHPRAQDFFDTYIAVMSDPVTEDFARKFLEPTVLAEQAPPAFVEFMLHENMKVPTHVWRAVFAGFLEDDLSARLNAITASTLIIWGDQDAILTRSDQEALAAALPNSRFVVYTGVGHSPHWEVPKRVAADLAAFVEGL